MADTRIGDLASGGAAQATDELPTDRGASTDTLKLTAAAIAALGGGPPGVHATTHQTGGSDAIALDTLAAPTDVTTLNATTSAHGLLPKLSNVATQFLNGVGGYTVPAGAGDFSGPASSVDSEVVLFSGTGGKTGKRATGTGPAKLTAGVLSASAVDLSGAEATGTLAAGRFPALTGPITTVAGALGTTVAANAITTTNITDANVTKAKIENVAADKLLGRGNGGGAGAPQEITLGTNLSMSGTTLNAAGGAGASVYARSTGFTYNTDSAERSIFAVTVVGGDLSTNKSLWVRMGGNYLCNSGTNTLTVRVKLGATTLWGDVTANLTNSATRRAWSLEYHIGNQNSASAQGMNGNLRISSVTAASVAGLGEIAVATSAIFMESVFRGAATEDTTSNKTLDVSWQWAVSNAANELVMDYAVAVLL